MTTKHANIPLFIPHMGCPHDCIFCNQKRISGKNAFSLETVEKEIAAAVATLHGRQAELAFFGGSFTAIDRSLMLKLLEIGKNERNKGSISGIRLSTRPDAVGEDILDILEEYGVTAIELGVQSASDEVLAASGRGHTFADTVDAFRRIRKRKRFSLAGQMMLGLPASTLQEEIETAQAICEMGADATRIYPTVVLKHSPLATLYKEKQYIPLTLEEGVRRGAVILPIFEKAGVNVLRMGLCAEESCEKDAIAGCYHPAYRELVEGELFLAAITAELEKENAPKGKKYTVSVARGALSKAIGQKKQNRQKLEEKFGCTILFKEDKTLIKRQVKVMLNKVTT